MTNVITKLKALDPQVEIIAKHEYSLGTTPAAFMQKMDAVDYRYKVNGTLYYVPAKDIANVIRGMRLVQFPTPTPATPTPTTPVPAAKAAKRKPKEA